MDTITVKDLMIPLSEYATTSEDASLVDAIHSLEAAQNELKKAYKHRGILVYDNHNSKKIVGKISQWDVLKALEPKYRQIGDGQPMSRYGLSKSFINSMFANFSILDEPFVDVCKKAAKIKVKDVMCTPTEGEYVDENATLTEAIHQLVMGHHMSLLVTRDSDIVGIVRLTDVFLEVCKTIKD
ncbi:MAG: CBS domain-containing protein [Desulfobacterales bacterium]|nr:CBS domain-containing protein [Desulfobacterales bacterium]